MRAEKSFLHTVPCIYGPLEVRLGS